MTTVKKHAERMKTLVGIATPAAFAKKCTVSGKTIQKALTGEITSHAVLEKISVATGKSIEWILGVEPLGTNNQEVAKQQTGKTFTTTEHPEAATPANLINPHMSTEETDSLDMVRQYSKVAEMDADTLGEVQAWINDMERVRPGFTAWFRLEFQNRFPEFDEWKGKVIKKLANGDNF